MTTAELELAPIEATRDSPLTLAALAVRPLSALEPTLLALSERYRDVAYDLKTPKGLTAMKAARHDLRENGRFAVQRASAEFKTAANAAKRAVDEMADRLVGIVRPQEDDFTRAIDAREAELEAEKAERARLEAERVERLTAAVATIRSYVQKAAGLPAERIARGIAGLESMTFPLEQWQEFAAQATAARDEALAALRLMHAAAVQAEADRAERERLEADAARLRAEVAAQRAESERLEALAVANRARLEAERLAEVTAAAAAMAARIQTRATATTPDGTVADASTGEILDPIRPDEPDAAPAPTLEEMGGEKPDVQDAVGVAEVNPQPSLPAAGSDEPTVKLGDLCARLGFTMTEAFVRDTLQIQPVPSKGRAVLIAEAALPALREALVSRVREVLAWEASA
jgi:hypothetical protein